MHTAASSILLTDLYQLSMMQGYYEQGMDGVAVFEFFVRELPENRNFYLAAGLEQVLDFLEKARFTEEELEWLAGLGRFSDAFLDSLRAFRFTGDVHAMPEGTIFFPNEPILRVTAPIGQAQLFETRIINLLQFQTLIASKAVRMPLAAPGRLLVDFGLRRAHGAEAGLFAARASYIAGFSGTSTVLAGQLLGIPVYGTMAHSFVQAHDTEEEAFLHFAQAQPGSVVLLIDTYATEAAAQKVVDLAARLREMKIAIKAVRLDSGDLVAHSRKVRAILDRAGLTGIRIFTSGNLDEYVLQRFTAENAPIDGFGVGTRMVTSADLAYLDCAYKLEEYAGIARRKRSEGKATWPGRKQVYRHFGQDGVMTLDVLTVADETRRSGRPLIKKVMESGKCLMAHPPLAEIRSHVRQQLEGLPADLKKLDKAPPFQVRVSAALQKLTMEVDQRSPPG